jgi:hypothetical protein
MDRREAKKEKEESGKYCWAGVKGDKRSAFKPSKRIHAEAASSHVSSPCTLPIVALVFLCICSAHSPDIVRKGVDTG